MKTIIYLKINNVEFSINVNSFDALKVLNGTLKIIKIKHNSDLNVTEYWMEGR